MRLLHSAVAPCNLVRNMLVKYKFLKFMDEDIQMGTTVYIMYLENWFVEQEAQIFHMDQLSGRCPLWKIIRSVQHNNIGVIVDVGSAKLPCRF